MCAREVGKLEVADIFRRYGDAYRNAHPMPVNRLRAMHAIEACRTAELGGHLDKCEHCGKEKPSYNSCLNRHCPKCQFLKKEKWIEARTADLLPVPYFHVVFTVPDDLNPLVLRNQEVLYNLLFKAASETLLELAEDPKRLGVELGAILILHTWGQNLLHHPHIHGIVPGGGLTEGGQKWKACRTRNFFIHVNVLSELFKKKFLAYLKKLRKENKLIYPGVVSPLAAPGVFHALISKLYDKAWVVYCKPPFEKTENVLEYLGRYTHRIAISNHRLVKLEDDTVYFRWRDYADHNKTKIMPVSAFEFIRRFLLHVLPDRFVKIRHYGLLGNRCRKMKLELCRRLLGCAENKTEEKAKETWQEALLRLTGIDAAICPACGERGMRTVKILQPARCKGPP